ncbi:MAG TPA: uracil-DNA glycosylase family protein [Chloroflexota bacterium]
MTPELARLHEDIRRCRACVAGGFIASAAPIATAEYEFDHPLSRAAYRGPASQGRIMLIGQAPGPIEAVAGEHFVGRAGRVLFRWLSRVGIAEEAWRRHVYMTTVTKCFPGKSRVAGGGDRRPTAAELQLCRPFLDRQIALLDPKLLVLVGKMAIDLYLPGRPLDELVGEVVMVDGRELLPLPHPSGMSRWLNSPANQARLDQALELLKERLGFR